MKQIKGQSLWFFTALIPIILALVLVNTISPSLLAHGWLYNSVVFAIGLLIATLGGILPIGKLLQKWGVNSTPSLEEAGRHIGILERFLIFVFLISAFPAATLIVPAIKSLVRFLDEKKDRPSAEYYLIGTFASVSWALICAYAIHYLIFS